MEDVMKVEAGDGAASGLSDVFGGFVAGAWVADGDQEQPRIAQVADCYELDGEWYLDLVMYRRDGTKIGRVSPACGGPRGFEPALPAASWELIEEPDWGWLAEPRYHWGDRLRRLKTLNAKVSRSAPLLAQVGSTDGLAGTEE